MGVLRSAMHAVLGVVQEVLRFLSIFLPSMQWLLAATHHVLHDVPQRLIGVPPSLLVSLSTMPRVLRKNPWLPGHRGSSKAGCGGPEARHARLAGAIHRPSFDEVLALLLLFLLTCELATHPTVVCVSGHRISILATICFVLTPLVILGALTAVYFYMHGPVKNMDLVTRLWDEALRSTFIFPSLASFDLTLVLRIPNVADLMRTF